VTREHGGNSSETGTGAPLQPSLVPIAWQDSIWFSDLDNTLVATLEASTIAADSISEVFEEPYSQEAAQAVKARFNTFFKLLRAGNAVRTDQDWADHGVEKIDYDRLMGDISASQRQVREVYGQPKTWSREVLIKLAADSCGLSVDPSLIKTAADTYWRTLSEHTEIFPDALDLVQHIYDHGRAFYIATSSDGRLIMQPDGQFTYDPELSKTFKRERIEILQRKGLRFSDIFIGDPEDKPELDFFQQTVSMAETDQGHSIDRSTAIMLGDSLRNDLLVPKEQLGFGLVVLREKGRQRPEVDDPHQLRVGSLTDVADFIT
jgi:hypothetical protein